MHTECTTLILINAYKYFKMTGDASRGELGLFLGALSKAVIQA